MKRQLSILASLLFFLILSFSSSGSGKAAATVSGKACLSRAINIHHASLYSASKKLIDASDEDAADDDSDDDYAHTLFLPFSVALHTVNPVSLPDTATHYLKVTSRHFFTPHLFLSNRTLLI